jgi:hypothetical protein
MKRVMTQYKQGSFCKKRLLLNKDILRNIGFFDVQDYCILCKSL